MPLFKIFLSMKKSLFNLIVVCSLITITTTNKAFTQNSVQKQLLSVKPMSQDASVLRHVVLFSFKENTSDQDVDKIVEAFSALPDKISQIKDYEWGLNNSPEGLNDGLTHCFLVTFASEEDRAIYLPHPEHQAFVKILRPHLEKAVVVDYWANEK